MYQELGYCDLQGIQREEQKLKKDDEEINLSDKLLVVVAAIL